MTAGNNPLNNPRFFFVADVDVISKLAQLEFQFGDAEHGKAMFENMLSTYPKRTDVWSVYIDVMIKHGSQKEVRWVLTHVGRLGFLISSKDANVSLGMCIILKLKQAEWLDFGKETLTLNNEKPKEFALEIHLLYIRESNLTILVILNRKGS